MLFTPLEENGDEQSESKFSDYTPERKRRSITATQISNSGARIIHPKTTANSTYRLIDTRARG